MAEYKQIHKVEVEKKPFKLTKKMIALQIGRASCRERV